MRIQILALVVIQSVLASLAHAQPTDQPTTKAHAPIGYLLIEEEQWNILADEPGRHMGRARDAFLMMDARDAAVELRKAAVHLKIAAGHAGENTKRALVRSERELEQLAIRIESGTYGSIEEFDIATARALHALANDHYAKAAEAWRKRELQRSGQYLRAAVDNLERGAARTDASMRQATAVVVKDTRRISGKLIEGTGLVVDDVGKDFELVGHAIERLATRLEPAPK